MALSKKEISERKTTKRLREFDGQYYVGRGIRLLAGVDEVGRGALAGPVVAGAVILDCDCSIPGVNDSKQLDEARREEVYEIICEKACAIAVGWASAEEIDQINIYQATLLASRRALGALGLKPDMILTDALRLEGLGVPVEPLIKGDSKSQAIAAASIVAKVTRDRWMRRLDAEYPGYGFASHKGYAVEFHLAALRELNASTIHRHTFRGVDWFEREYRVSETLGQIMREMRDGYLDAVGLDDIWQSRGYMLPECEYRMLCHFLEQ